MKFNIYRSHWCVVLAALAALGCASHGKPPKPYPPYEGPRPADAVDFPRVTLTQDFSPLDDTVRWVGERIGGGLVSMNGIGDRPLPPLKMKRKPYEYLVAQLAMYTGCQFYAGPYYFFLYAPGYETLMNISLHDRLHDRYAGLSGAMAFGANTELFNVFAMLSKSLDITVIADNPIADSRCGEMALPEIPLRAALEAILQSARIAPGAFSVDGTEEYVFFHSLQNRNPRSLLLNESDLNSDQLALLNRKVSLMLPEPPMVTAGMVFRHNASALGQVLGPMSSQMGVRVGVEDARLLPLPVNPCVMNNVRIRTAMDLLIRQWPLPDFGYVLRGDQIVIVRRNTVPAAE